jgi:integrase
MRKDRKYPKGSKISAWALEMPSSGKPRIRRTIRTPDNQRWTENHPLVKFKHLLENKRELEDFVTRLNGKDPRIERIKLRLDFEHAFIGPDFLDEYQNVYLRSFIPSEATAQTLTFYLKHYALNYFIGRCGLANPLEWKQHEAYWGLALIDKAPEGTPKVFDDNKPRSSQVIKMVIYELNRFMRYLHSKHPDIPPLVFEPLSRAIFKDYEARRAMRGEKRETSYIPEADWQTIRKHLPESWGCLVELSYLYGLRRKEAYGLILADVKKGFLSVERQLDKRGDIGRTFRPLKSRNQRRTPHWFCTPAYTYKLIEQLENLTLHPDTVGDLFIEHCQKLGLTRYTLHDLRRSFITNCVRKGINQEELRLAVGHVDGATTYKYYVKDARDLTTEVWTPDDDVA